MKRLAPYIALGLLAYLIALAATLPARQGLAAALPYLRSHGIQPAASGISGSVWEGRIRALAVNGSRIGALQWSLSPLALLTGRAALEWRVRPDGGFVEGWSAVSLFGRVEAEEVSGRLPVELLARFSPRRLPVELGGEISLRLERLAMAEGRLERLEGRLLWNGAGVAQPLAAEFGDLAMDLQSGEGGVIVGTVQDGGGPLIAEGSVRLHPDGRYTVDLAIAARAGASTELTQALSLLGRPDRRGRYQIDIAGRLR